MIHNDILENMIVDVHNVDQFLEYLRKDFEYFRIFGSFENSLKSFQSLQYVHFSQRHLILDEFVIYCRRVITDQSD